MKLKLQPKQHEKENGNNGSWFFIDVEKAKPFNKIRHISKLGQLLNTFCILFKRILQENNALIDVACWGFCTSSKRF